MVDLMKTDASLGVDSACESTVTSVITPPSEYGYHYAVYMRHEIPEATGHVVATDPLVTNAVEQYMVIVRNGQFYTSANGEDASNDDIDTPVMLVVYGARGLQPSSAPTK
ncbi:hypothetical protein T265_04745 [Opisthorchis viverrini]|uniref:Uncharacterized protein n=1 Tax=Opisthorchis viverrini TaxID=6198 RepID=A0A075AG65_OPIVI|nr:hypothetical protein T265_04745 [Opisthorchis viverrini]KER28439.1 hypothetical protein T265_04745 [Opisthorchis viverrini]